MGQGSEGRNMHRLKGISMIIVGAMLWGATGPMMEWLLKNTNLAVPTMTATRLLVAGVIILGTMKMKGMQITLLWRQKVWARKLLLFGVFGMLGAQYAFVQSINASNAVIATLFQFLAPIYIIVFVSWGHRRFPPLVQILGMIVTLGGLFLLLTNGSLAGFVLSKAAVIWGIVLGFTFSFYTLYPVRLMQEWGVLLPVGWGMVIGGLAMFITTPLTILKQTPQLLKWDVASILLLIIVVGTVAFILFLSSMKYITPIETSILTSFEPLTAIAISALWLGQVLGVWQMIGAFVMLIGVTWLSIAGSKVRTK